MATTTPNFGWAVPTSTDLVKDGAVAIETLGDSIDASLVDLKGGTTGQVLSKATNTNMDFTWITPSGASSGPAFSARAATGQNITVNTATKVTFGTEDFDTAGNFASSRFTPTTAGYYQINTSVVTSTDSNNYHEVWIYKNGSFSARVGSFGTIANAAGSGGAIIYFNGSSDYVEVYARVGGSNTRIDSGDGQTVFSGVWIRS